MRHQHAGVVRRQQLVDAAGDHAQRIDVEAGVGFIEQRQFRLQQRHLQDFVALFLAAGKTVVDAATQEFRIHFQQFHFFAHQIIELQRVEFILAAAALHRVVGEAQERAVGDAGNLHRILEAEKNAGAGTFIGGQREQVLALEQHFTTLDHIGRVPRQNLGEGALAGTVGPHDRMHFAGTYREVDALEDVDTRDGRRQVADFKDGFCVAVDHPTLPSSFRPRSLVASTANSIGSCWKTSLQKPLMIIDTASSVGIPRLWK